MLKNAFSFSFFNLLFERTVIVCIHMHLSTEDNNITSDLFYSGLKRLSSDRDQVCWALQTVLDYVI